jgi:hypothetical protein
MSDTTRKIVISAKTTCLALFWGGLSGIIAFIGLAFFAIGPISLMGVFGGVGLILLYTPFNFLIPFIHCIYVFIILRWNLHGILFVIVLHYLSAFIMAVVWIQCDFHPKLWHFIEVHNTSSNPFGYLSLIITVPPAVGIIVVYNALLFFLLWRALKS